MRPQKRRQRKKFRCESQNQNTARGIVESVYGSRKYLNTKITLNLGSLLLSAVVAMGSVYILLYLALR